MKVVRKTLALALLLSCFKASGAAEAVVVASDDASVRCTQALDIFLAQVHDQSSDRQDVAAALADVLSCVDELNYAAAVAIATQYTHSLPSARDFSSSDASATVAVDFTSDIMTVTQGSVALTAPVPSTLEATVADGTQTVVVRSCADSLEQAAAVTMQITTPAPTLEQVGSGDQGGTVVSITPSLVTVTSADSVTSVATDVTSHEVTMTSSMASSN